ncbi:MAG: anhydro-N-acetylmuramic acid kinase, partial [Chitinophagaceae bacterium]
KKNLQLHANILEKRLKKAFMNKNIRQLFEISCKNARNIIGLMSGTSLDGLDIALCKITGSGTSTKVSLQAFETISYNHDFKTAVKGIFSKKEVNLEMVCLLNEWIAEEHAKMIVQCLEKWEIPTSEVDVIASHGQTIYHAPKALHQKQGYGNATLQIGDGDHLAVKTGIITLSDFRQKHIAAGGEGAPLAVYGDYLIFSEANENRMMLNIGGIANFTYLPGNLDATAVFSTDTGPGNTMMDAYVQTHFNNIQYDKDSAIALKGAVNYNLLEALINNDFFQQPFPKTTGPELFNLHYLQACQKATSTENLTHEDVMATLNKFSAVTIIDALKRTTTHLQAPVTVYASGGGMHNPLLMQTIKAALPHFIFKTTDELAVNPDAKEAVLFAVLANETLAGGNTNYAGVEKGIPTVCMGKISFPA